MKTYRGNMQSVDPQDALLSLDAFCRKHEAFLCDLLKVTSRPTSKMLCDATAKVWPGQSPLEHKTFNNHVSEVVKVLFGKARSMTTGQRLPDSVSSMCKFIRATILDPNVSASPGKRQLAIMDDPGNSPAKPVLPCKRPKGRRVLKEHISLSSGTGSEAPDEAHLQVAKAGPAASASSKQILPRAEPAGNIAARYAASSSSTTALHGSIVYHVDMSVSTVWRISGGSRQQATLKPGPLGFAVATWGDQERSTEIPNLVLEKRAQHPAKEAAGKPQPAAKKKAGSKAKAKAKSKVACKKPATVLQDAQDSESAEEAPAGAPAEAPEDAVKPTERTERLRKEYRSATNSVSIRAIWRDDEHKEKKRQLFELRGLDAISKEKLLELAEESCAKILEGQDEATVKSWALDELNKRKNV